jgi:hypothetical protein
MFLLLFCACSTLRLKPAKFAWPVESVLMVDSKANVTDERYSISFNTAEVFYEEFKDSTGFKDTEIRLLRNINGYYFLTAISFKNVYVFEIDDGDLVLENKILVDAKGLENPALNQREAFVELISGKIKLLLTEDGIHMNEDKE